MSSWVDWKLGHASSSLRKRFLEQALLRTLSLITMGEETVYQNHVLGLNFHPEVTTPFPISLSKAHGGTKL